MSFVVMKVLNQVERRFKERLQRKVSWGKNEVLAEYQEAVKEVVDSQTDDPYNTDKDIPLMG